MRYSILIVDDEKIIRDGLIARLEYLNINPPEIYEAESVTAALDIMKDKKPEIVITDIQMPGMSGIELIGAIRQENAQVQFIILTGYAEFVYAEQAIQFGVSAYLLKPVSNSQLEKVIKEAAEKLDRIYEMQTITRTVQQMKKQNEQMVLEQALNDLYFNNQEYEHSKIILKQHLLAIGEKTVSAVIHVDSSSYSGEQFGYQDIELIRKSIKGVFDEIFRGIIGKYFGLCVSSLANRSQLLVLLGGMQEILSISVIEHKFSKLQTFLWKKMGVSVTVGISRVREEICKHSYDEAMEGIAQRVIHGNGNIYFYEDIPELKNENFPTTNLVMLKNCLERHDIGNVEFVLKDIFDPERLKGASTGYLRIACMQIFNLISKNAVHAIPMEKINQFMKLLDCMEAFSSVEELVERLFEFIAEGMQGGVAADANTKSKIRLAIQYIDANYNQDIAIDELASRYAMSPNYFSSVFKKETNTTTINYIKNLRIQKACELLVKTNKNVMEISKDVGYEDSQYFFRVFKGVIGKTPLQYRSEQSSLHIKVKD